MHPSRVQLNLVVPNSWTARFVARLMESSLVLRAASCWNAWGEAMNILKIKRLEEETAKRFVEQAYVLGPHILAYPMLTTGESHHRSVVRD